MSNLKIKTAPASSSSSSQVPQKLLVVNLPPPIVVSVPIPAPLIHTNNCPLHFQDRRVSLFASRLLCSIRGEKQLLHLNFNSSEIVITFSSFPIEALKPQRSQAAVGNQ